MVSPRHDASSQLDVGDVGCRHSVDPGLGGNWALLLSNDSRYVTADARAVVLELRPVWRTLPVVTAHWQPINPGFYRDRNMANFALLLSTNCSATGKSKSTSPKHASNKPSHRPDNIEIGWWLVGSLASHPAMVRQAYRHARANRSLASGAPASTPHRPFGAGARGCPCAAGVKSYRCWH